MINWIWGGIAAGVGAYILILGGVFVGQRRLLYFPSSKRPGPAESGVAEMVEVSLVTEDSHTLLAWHSPPRYATLPTLVYFHGNAGHIGMRGYKVRPYLDAGMGVLLTTWRGYSGNPGDPSAKGLYRDGRAALAYLEAAGVKSEKIVLYGESLGTGVAVHLARERAHCAVVLEAPYSSIPDVAQVRLPLLPVKSLIFDRFDSTTKIADVGAPVLIVHGARDLTIPPRFGKRLYRAAAEPKKLHIYPEAGHNDLYNHGMAALVLEFLRWS